MSKYRHIGPVVAESIRNMIDSKCAHAIQAVKDEAMCGFDDSHEGPGDAPEVVIDVHLRIYLDEEHGGLYCVDGSGKWNRKVGVKHDVGTVSVDPKQIPLPGMN